MTKIKAVVTVGKIQQRILFIRGEKVIIDSDLADFNGVPTRRLNEQVKRNRVEWWPSSAKLVINQKLG